MEEKEILKRQKIINIIGISVSVLAGLIGLYGQSKDPQTGIIMFVLLFGAILLYFIISYPIGLIKDKVNKIDKNYEFIERMRKDLNTLKDKLNFRRDVEELNIRISILENLFKMKGKKGIIDPRLIIIIIILIFLYLYLKSKGFF